MKLARCLSDSCQAFAAHALARGLRLHPNATRGAVAAFSSASHRLAVQSHDDVLSKIRENASVVKDARDAFAPVQSYMNSV